MLGSPKHDCNETAKSAGLRFLRQFGRDDDGSIIVLTLMTIVMMLVLGGMAVDFMRFESRRVTLQSVADRAVLAAAELDLADELKPDEVVIDYFRKAGLEHAIVGNVGVLGDGQVKPPADGGTGPGTVVSSGSRQVTVNAALDLNTFYLKLIGIDQLRAPASSQALEGTGNIEISLVLDISGSMRHSVGGDVKIESLRTAANSFVTQLLKPEYEDQISISLVTYSTQVNIGDHLFRAIQEPDKTIGDSISPNSIHLDPSHALYSPHLAIEDPNDPDSKVSFTNPSRCLDLPASAYSTEIFDPSLTYPQVETFQQRIYRQGHWGADRQDKDNRLQDQPICPNASYEAIIPHSQSAVQLTGAIDQLQARQYTSIYLGMKWGVTLLDPSMRPLVAGVPGLDADFVDVRPSNYAQDGDSLNTKKYVVLMTDGKNQATDRLTTAAYQTVAERLRWSLYNHPYYIRHINSYPSLASISRPANFTASQGDTLLQNICTAAKAREITVYTIAMGADSHGNTQMANCASEHHYYQTSGTQEGIQKIFDEIGEQITALRLSL